MKFWRLLCVCACLAFVLVMVVAYWMQDPADNPSNRGADAPRTAPHIAAFN